MSFAPVKIIKKLGERKYPPPKPSKPEVGSTESAPSLVVSVRPLKGSLYFIKVVHPNTKAILFEKAINAACYEDAFVLAKCIRDEKFSEVQTFTETKLLMSLPKRGKMELMKKKPKRARKCK